MSKLENKTVFLTGAASGIGAAIASEFVKEGATLVLMDKDLDKLNDLSHQIPHETGRLITVGGDVSREEDVRRFIEKGLSHFGGVDVLINNAGIMDDFCPVAETPIDLWNNVLAVNLNSCFYTSRLVIPIMEQAKRGVIINISSVAGSNGGRAGAAYTVSKHAMEGLTRNIAFMYAIKGIRCNAIAPGGVNTNIGKNMHPNEFGYNRANSGTASMPRMGESDEIAKVALFLSSEDSSYINGSIITVDGGWTAY
jgi:NAD(P)-dependent dehydrogenase (short-subunit alcohol dehydrogenase family)